MTKPTPESIYTLCYTSGTTGDPKGVMVKHKNMTANTAGCMYGGANFNDADSYLSFLPLAHMAERSMLAIIYFMGVQMGFYSGDVLKLREDM